MSQASRVCSPHSAVKLSRSSFLPSPALPVTPFFPSTKNASQSLLPQCRPAHVSPATSAIQSLPRGNLTLPVPRQRSTVGPIAASGDSAAGAAVLALNDIPFSIFINTQGRIEPVVEPGTAASVFAVYDSNKKAQYIGFSKDVRNSLRTLMGRRPELCYYFKLLNLVELDQDKMLAIRNQWFSELGLPPPGNTEPSQRTQWEQPADAGSISERGKAAAAMSKAKMLLQTMADRGLKEEMVYDPALIEEGKCDIVASMELSDSEKSAAAAVAAASAAKTKKVRDVSPSGEAIDFEVYFDAKYPTNGGWMYDLRISKDDKDTTHRVICGRQYPESVDMHEDDFVIRMFSFLLDRRLPRQTEGILTSDQFAINYFAVSDVVQWYDDFQKWFDKPLPDTYWRFNRIHSYGAENAPWESINPDMMGAAGSASEWK